jgi:hypothetical protein
MQGFGKDGSRRGICPPKLILGVVNLSIIHTDAVFKQERLIQTSDIICIEDSDFFRFRSLFRSIRFIELPYSTFEFLEIAMSSCWARIETRTYKSVAIKLMLAPQINRKTDGTYRK